MKLNKILTPVIGLPLVVLTGLSTMVSCETKKYKTPNFETDSWDAVGNFANQGLNALKQHYQLDSFIGLEREVTVFNVVHKVRVIGEGEDILVDEQGQPTGEVAALTFQFSTILTRFIDGEDKPTAITMPFWDDESELHTENRWKDSDIREFLNNDESDDSFKNQLENSIGSNFLKHVGKTSFTDLTNPDPEEEGGAAIEDECIFLLSLGDIYNADRGQMPDELENDYFYPEESNLIDGGHLPYSFFLKNIDMDWRWYMPIDCLSLSDATGLNYNYWLRTGCTTPAVNAEILEPYYGQWVIGGSGACKFLWDDIDYPYTIQWNGDDVGLAPCFCI